MQVIGKHRPIYKLMTY